MNHVIRLTAALVFTLLLSVPARGTEVVVDYTYDTNNFFDPGTANGMAARAAMQAAADRYSRILTSPLGLAELNDTNDWRIGFTHPGNGMSWEISGASSEANDSLANVMVSGGGTVGPADEYQSLTFAQDQWIIYAGGRVLGSAGEGGTGTGTNFTSTYNNGGSHLNRGFRATGSVNNLPVWGGSISFDTGTNWHFGVSSPATGSESDFYSIALHEIGHALGLSTSWDDFGQFVSGDQYAGSETVLAANEDNPGANLTDLDLVSSANLHFGDNDGNISGGGSIPADPDAIQSFIFAPGSPNLAGTVGLGTRQDLLMEPIANFVDPTVRRFELTNVDVAALRDIGWTTITAIPEPSSTALLAIVGCCVLRRQRRG